MNKQKKFLLVFLFFCLIFIFQKSFAQGWQELKGEHFIIYFTQDDKFARQVLDKAEYFYQKIATDLGYPRYSEFWLWDKRVKIYIYPDHASFLNATGQPNWSKGMADYTNKQIKSFIWSEGFVESLLPHEMAHLIFRDFVGFKGEIPLWIDEGVAQWEEEAKRNQVKRVTKEFLKKNSLISLQDMMKLDIRYIRNEADKIYIRSIRIEGKPGILIISGKDLISTYYLQSVSLVGFLIEKYGKPFVNFCRELRDGESVEEALRFSYPGAITNFGDLEEKWQKYIVESSP